MSNYSVVIVTWPSTDGGPQEFTQRHERRFDEILAAYDETNQAWLYVPYCGLSHPEETGACQFMAIAHINHFQPDELIQAISSFRWEDPDEVQVLWKDKEMVRFQIERMSAPYWIYYDGLNYEVLDADLFFGEMSPGVAREILRKTEVALALESDGPEVAPGYRLSIKRLKQRIPE